ncbi:MAG: hypothetical protein GF409_01100 [Candidatus Omnitrophica bacterium]|nr:hypothetical protein [Candidatus Omnitrophota bacterium]
MIKKLRNKIPIIKKAIKKRMDEERRIMNRYYKDHRSESIVDLKMAKEIS